MQKYKRLKVYFYQLNTMFVSRFGICNYLRQFFFTLTVCFFFFVCFPVRFFPLCFVRSLFLRQLLLRVCPTCGSFDFSAQRMDEVDGRGAMTAPPNNASSPEVFGGWNKQMHPQKQHARPRTRYKADREMERDRETLLC